ncbi:uncharacterized protein LAESUDRAFT_706886 [Laetiporus sulphureus 93-53]|uniref:F-box domain-containing protein n=1 Tax=Laetiporus sulphureus 93-53 TaxID=1314785 RepID=A0A165BXW8_9APHY|nr:uncharacterized protein LAESUDRAFT_706886 [Laetiporus sulphureus 93-53]KZT01850.1 hypothetical protein LAESUDRAFT_706886 [Laetiporus sulphureus 93-53]
MSRLAQEAIACNSVSTTGKLDSRSPSIRVLNASERCTTCNRPWHAAPALPTEILYIILQLVDSKHDLATLLRVSKLFHPIAFPALYRSIPNMRPVRRMIACLNTLATDASKAELVRTLVVDWSMHRVLGNLLRLLNRALKQLRFLRHLSIELSPYDNQSAQAWVFSGANFQLQTLSTSARCDEGLARFLETQPSIRELSLRGFQTNSPFILSSSALPHLISFRTVHAGIPELSTVIKGRPLEVVSISLYQGDGFAPLDTLTLASGHIKRLTLMSFEDIKPDDMLAAVACRLPQLEALYIVVLLGNYDEKMLLKAGNSLSNFHKLQYITFMAGQTTSLEDEHGVATYWHKSCPTLKTIILPKGQVWFLQEGRWTCYA